MKKFFKPAILALSIITLTACSSDDDTPDQINEEEVINQVVLTITETGTTNTETYEWNEGTGASANIVIDAGKSYEATVGFFDNSDPANKEDITEEVIAEADEHQVFYEVASNTLTITSAANDIEDNAGNPIGINTVWSGTGTTQTSVVIYLVHEPTSKTGETRDDLGGETDVQVSFPVVVN
ncbi:type 1 periplasmic binding fold superfamily protein [Robertkochia marina]|uniref:Type 1 periplasmic binding fold superfamily protein n=1 Tax=Robertkochia marina TaxID=1227945 RepID=A0A4S3M058_9FLAO|nr:type 1 periplasmic binding fold superfamily protein [Robertkochia marina]THD67548.1 type 1 periplasmic binding fold superfamily protein [Robertkochia marina]TRZ44584.1 type 1 periplasmic binding fold superfamily protein [Robertkochia marina]